MEQYRHELREKVRELLIDFRDNGTTTELHLLLLGFSRTGKQALSKSTGTWTYSFTNIPGGLEYLCRYNALFKRDFRPMNAEGIGLARAKMDVGTNLSYSSGDSEHIREFVDTLPQWPELGYKPRWGKWLKNETVENTWNAAPLAVLYELVYGKPVHIMNLVNVLKTKEFQPTCQINLCTGDPGPKNKLFSVESRKDIIEALVAGTPAEPLEVKELGIEKEKPELKIKFNPS